MVRISDETSRRGLTLERRDDGQLWLEIGGVRHSVRVRRCFPWSEPGRFLSLRDVDDREVVLIERLEDLAPAARSVLAEA